MPVLLALALPAPPAGAADLGRLFYTPEQRAALDQARAKRVRTAVATDETAPPAGPPAPPAPEVVRYGGVVRRSDGRTTIWINNRAMTAAEAAQAPLVGQIRADGSVVLKGQQSERSVSLKVGQRAELTSGTVEEGYVAVTGAATAEPGERVQEDAKPAQTPRDTGGPNRDGASPEESRARPDGMTRPAGDSTAAQSIAPAGTLGSKQGPLAPAPR